MFILYYYETTSYFHIERIQMLVIVNHFTLTRHVF